MGFSLSPVTNFKETDLTSTIPAVATSIGALVGEFVWGPVMEPTQITSENELVDRFGISNGLNFIDWMSAKNFLSYANDLQLVRVAGAAAVNACSDAAEAVRVENTDDFEASSATIEALDSSFIAKYPGTYGNTIGVDTTDVAGFAAWTHNALFEYAPTGTQVCLAIKVGADVVETFLVDMTPGSVDAFGNSNYAPDIINQSSQLIWVNLDTDTVGADTGWDGTPEVVTLTGGTDVAPISADRQLGWDEFAGQIYDVNLLIGGNASNTDMNYIIQNIAEVRKDCVALVGPQYSDVVGVNVNATIVSNVITDRDAMTSSSYAIYCDNYKYQYDKYNNVYGWVNLTGDVAGVIARNDDANDPWISPAGYVKGQIKNVVKMAYTPTLANRDSLYKNGINPILTFPGRGTILFGDKTMLSAQSAFDRINVRRLFITIEKAITTSADNLLFDINDSFTRNLFRNQVEPFLRDVQGRRGIYDFRVIADETNNTPTVIDRNEFRGDIYIKPARSINFIYLNFIAVATGVVFEEILV